MRISITSAILALFNGVKSALKPSFFHILRRKTSFEEEVQLDEKIREAIEDEEERKDERSDDLIVDKIRRSPVMASLFPCLCNKSHSHPLGKPHTCNSFLLAPAGPAKRKPGFTGHRIGSHMIYVSNL